MKSGDMLHYIQGVSRSPPQTKTMDSWGHFKSKNLRGNFLVFVPFSSYHGFYDFCSLFPYLALSLPNYVWFEKFFFTTNQEFITVLVCLKTFFPADNRFYTILHQTQFSSFFKLFFTFSELYLFVLFLTTIAQKKFLIHLN